MKDIIIVCAGGFGFEVYTIINSINDLRLSKGMEKKYNILGFLSDVPDALNGKKVNVGIIGDIQNWYPRGDEVYALGLSDPKGKEKIATMLKERGAKFESLVAPWSLVPSELEMGEGCVITAYSISPGAVLGNFVNVMGSMVGTGAILGDYTTTTGFANITSAQLGKRVYVGSHAVIMNHKKVGDDAFICVGSVVINNVKAGTKVFGVPAKKVEW